MKKNQELQDKIKAWGDKYEQVSPKERVDLMRENIAQYRAHRTSKHIDWGLFGKRFFAKLIDFVVMLFPMIFVVIPIVSFDERFWPLVIFGVLVAPVYIALADGFHGAGVGKRCMGLRVIDGATGELIGYKQSAYRSWLVTRSSIILDPLVMVITKENRSIRDYAGATRVVRKQETHKQ